MSKRKFRSSIRRLGAWHICAIAAAVALAGGLLAWHGVMPGEENEVPKKAGKVIVESGTPEEGYMIHEGGLRAFIDPETGQLREITAEDIDPVSKSAKIVPFAAVEGPIQTEDGEALRVPAEMISFTVAHIDENGNLTTQHAQGPDGVRKAATKKNQKNAKERRHDQ